MWWIVLVIILILFILFRFFIWLTGNWRASLNTIITQYIALIQEEPSYSSKEAFMVVLNNRYPNPRKDIAGLRSKLYENKNNIIAEIENEIESGLSVLNKYNLPTLIYVCLVIEGNSYINQNQTIEEQLETITQEVIRQGFDKYV